MPDLTTLANGNVEIIDLTAPLSSRTPIIQLPEPFVNTPGFTLSELSRYDDDRGFWYWNAIETGEHVGTHVDAPNHWITGRDLIGVDEIPLEHLIAPAVVIDKSEECADDPDFLLEVSHIEDWQSENGDLPEGGWLLFRTGWDERSDDQERFLNADADGPHTPGPSVECAEWIANSPIVGMGVETVGTDAGIAGGMSTPFPCHSHLLGAGKYGLTQLQNVGRLPAVGTTLVVAPLPIVNGSGSPARVFALVPEGGS